MYMTVYIYKKGFVVFFSMIIFAFRTEIFLTPRKQTVIRYALSVNHFDLKNN